MEYRYRALEGVDERWGGSVFHCPFCHGWEHRDEPLAVLPPEGGHRVACHLVAVRNRVDGGVEGVVGPFGPVR